MSATVTVHCGKSPLKDIKDTHKDHKEVGKDLKDAQKEHKEVANDVAFLKIVP